MFSHQHASLHWVSEADLCAATETETRLGACDVTFWCDHLMHLDTPSQHKNMMCTTALDGYSVLRLMTLCGCKHFTVLGLTHSSYAVEQVLY